MEIPKLQPIDTYNYDDWGQLSGQQDKRGQVQKGPMIEFHHFKRLDYIYPDDIYRNTPRPGLVDEEELVVQPAPITEGFVTWDILPYLSQDCRKCKHIGLQHVTAECEYDWGGSFTHCWVPGCPCARFSRRAILPISARRSLMAARALYLERVLAEHKDTGIGKGV